MPSTRYKIWSFGPSVGEGITQANYIGVSGVAKAASDDLPFVITNELICSYLAKAILLPIPPGFVIEDEGIPYFVSLNFNLVGEDLPPANVSKIVKNHPELSCGIILFDLWILNNDRHTNNISYDKDSDRVQIFDHSHALMTNKDLFTDSTLGKTNIIIDEHCLARELEDLDGMVKWLNRIQSIPEYYIREVVESAMSFGLNDESPEICISFLLERQMNLQSLISENLSMFPKIQPTLFDSLFKIENDIDS